METLRQQVMTKLGVGGVVELTLRVVEYQLHYRLLVAEGVCCRLGDAQ